MTVVSPTGVFVPHDERHPLSGEARQVIIEHNRTMKEQRAFARANRERIAAEWNALEAPPLTIEQHIEHARKLREADHG